MKKIYLFVTLSIIVLLLQECKKDTFTETSVSGDHPFSAVINDTTWDPDTVNATITYNSATNTKVFTCTAVALNKEVYWSISINSTSNTAGFPLTTYQVSTTPNVSMIYYTTKRNSLGQNVLTPFGTVEPGSGSVVVTAIDSVKKTMTGTFDLSPLINNYDDSGNIISVNRARINSGAFTNMPYKFVSN